MKRSSYLNKTVLLILVPFLSIGLISCDSDLALDDSNTPKPTQNSNVKQEDSSKPDNSPLVEDISENDSSDDSNTFIENQDYNFNNYREIAQVDCTSDGNRAPNSYMEIGHGDREYYGFTNEHSQLVHVYADEIILQDDSSENVNNDGRYCSSMAEVPGVESSDYDRGHIIADSLGGNSSAFNITPQESTLNRHGDQSYMENSIRNANGATDFKAYITYPDDETQIPSHYDFHYTIKGNEIHDSFANGNPEEVNENLGIYDDTPVNNDAPIINDITMGDITSIDTNSNGKVSINEAKKAGFQMPIKSDHWLYSHMTDGNNNGMVGE